MYAVRSELMRHASIGLTEPVERESRVCSVVKEISIYMGNDKNIL